MSEEDKVIPLRKYPRDYYASEQDLKNPKWRRFRPWPAKRVSGYEMKAGVVAVRHS
jgi:hypothetical protein